MNRIVFFIGFFILALQVNGTRYTDCGSVDGTVIDLQVSNCPDSEEKCILKRGTKVLLSIVFQSKTESSSVKTHVHGIIVFVPIPFHMPHPEACGSILTCPIKRGQTYNYTTYFNIKKSYPQTVVDVKWELRDDKGRDIVCLRIPCKIE